MRNEQKKCMGRDQKSKRRALRSALIGSENADCYNKKRVYFEPSWVLKASAKTCRHVPPYGIQK